MRSSSDGMPHIHDLIDFTVGALIVHDKRILLVDHKAIRQWLAPGGHIELAEDTDQALFREIEEETGLRRSDLEILSAKPDLPRALYSPNWINIHPITDHHRHIVLIYVFRSKSSHIRLSPGEHHAIRWFSSSELNDPALNIPTDVRWYAQEAIRLTSV